MTVYRDAATSLHGAMRDRRRPSLSRNWRDRLPAPADYYAHRITKLGKPNAAGWAQGLCPFHEDHSPSFSVQMIAGRWRCFGPCGSGDMIDFHCRLNGLSFLDAVLDLTGMRP